MPVRVSVEGLEEAKCTLQIINQMGNVFKGVELNAKSRKDDDSMARSLTNGDILDYMAGPKQRRDFVAMTDELLHKIDVAISNEIERRLQEQQLSESEKAGVEDSKRRANEIGAAAFTKGALVWNEEITRRINSGDWLGGGDSELNPEYEKQKQKKHGFTRPIGVATGQVLDNVSPSKRNIRPISK